MFCNIIVLDDDLTFKQIKLKLQSVIVLTHKLWELLAHKFHGLKPLLSYSKQFANYMLQNTVSRKFFIFLFERELISDFSVFFVEYLFALLPKLCLP